MRPIRDRSSTITWQECCPTSKPKSSGAPIRPKDSSYCPGAGSLNAPSPGSTAVEDLPRTGRTSIARASHSCALPQSASCCENSVIPLDVLGQTLRAICACFDNLTIQIGISTSGIAPRYIEGHAFFLNASPNRLVVEQGARSPDCASEIFDRDRPKLDSCCFAAGNSRFVGVNNGIGQSADTGYDGNCSVSQGAKLSQSAGFKPRRHHERIHAGLDLVSQFLIIADGRADLIRVGCCGRLVTALKVRISAPQQRYLRAIPYDGRQVRKKEIKPFLPGQATDHTEQESVGRDSKTKSPL